ncbi:MAG: DUF4430 domain-containing protein [Anaerovoracaceae bacterium]|jgi:hypothetical protein
MKTRKARTALLLSLLVITASVLCACAEQNPSEDIPENKALHLTITMTYPEKVEPANYIKDYKFRVEKGTSLLEGLQLFCKVNDISLNIDTTNNVVEGINGVNNGDMKHYEWKCRINDEEVTDSPDTVKLKDNDHVEWYYTKVK